MHYLNIYDYGIITIYFGVLIGLGFYLQKRASASIENYFLGGRSLPWWALGISGMANYLDLSGTMLIVSFLYMIGTKGLFIEFRGGACLVLSVCMLWTGKWHRRSKCITGAEWMIYRFGNGFGGQFAQLTAVLAIITGTIGMIAYLIKGVGLFMSMFLPLTPFHCALILIAVATLYTIISGFLGVVFTDIFQSGIILLAVFIISIMAILKIDNSAYFAGIATSVTGNTQWMTSKLQWLTEMPRGYEPYKHLMLFSSFYLLRNVFGGMGMGAEPRYFGARNDKECGTLSFLWISLLMFRWPLMIAFAVLGIYLVKDSFPDQSILLQAADVIKAHTGIIPKNQWPELMANIINTPEKFPIIVQNIQGILGADWQQKLHMLSYEGTINPEKILPAVILHSVPVGLRGLILVALAAACLSTFSGSINMATSFFTRDIYQKLKPLASTRELVLASRIFTVISVIISFIFAYQISTINSIWGWITMGLGGGLMVPSVLRLYWWRFNGGGFAVGTVVGIFAAVFNEQIWNLLCLALPLGELNEWKLFLLMLVIGTIASIAGTYLTKPTNRDILEHFYKTTKPFGIWGNLKSILKPQVIAIMRNEHKNDLLALPFTVCWQITLFLLPMQLIIKNYTEFWFTLGIFIISLAGVYIFWFRNLPEKNFYDDDILKN